MEIGMKCNNDAHSTDHGLLDANKSSKPC